MRRVMVRYRVKPDRADENKDLVRAVYRELHEKNPDGLRYMTFRLEDGVSFVHISESEGNENPLSKVDAFQEFQREIEDRCEEGPVVTPADEVGSYRFRAGEAS
jgi:hypothetical protein